MLMPVGARFIRRSGLMVQFPHRVEMPLWSGCRYKSSRVVVTNEVTGRVTETSPNSR